VCVCMCVSVCLCETSVYSVGRMCVLDVSFPSKQSTLPAESVAAYGRPSTIREGLRATSAGDVHAGGQQGVHHVQTGLCCCRSQVCRDKKLKQNRHCMTF